MASQPVEAPKLNASDLMLRPSEGSEFAQFLEIALNSPGGISRDDFMARSPHLGLGLWMSKIFSNLTVRRRHGMYTARYSQPFDAVSVTSQHQLGVMLSGSGDEGQAS